MYVEFACAPHVVLEFPSGTRVFPTAQKYAELNWSEWCVHGECDGLVPHSGVFPALCP